MFNTEKRELKKLKKRIEKSGLFDNTYYLKTYQDARLSDLSALEHYCDVGIKEKRKPNNDFDPIWYLSQYKDIYEDKIDPFSHYILFGQKENRIRNAKEFLEIQDKNIDTKENNSSLKKTMFQHIDSDSYLNINTDIKESIEKGQIDDVLSHFILFGYDEIKAGKRRLGIEYPFFNEAEYINNNVDIKNALNNKLISSAFNHFLEHGHKEFLLSKRVIGGYYPFELTDKLELKLRKNFDEESYLEVNPDIKTAIENNVISSGIEHFINHGLEEVRFGKRSIHSKLPIISEADYLLSNKDVLVALKSGIISSIYEHFLLYGIEEMIDGKRKIPGKVIYTYRDLKLTENIKDEINNFKNKPLISIIMPVYNVDPKWLDLAIKSIKNQWYTNWELCIADDKSTKTETIEYLKSIKDEKIKIKFLEKNLNISGASNEALTLTSGEYILLMDNDDEITPDALYEVIKAINEKNADFIYSDEDKMEMDGSFCDPHFKPDFSLDLFLCQNYLSHLGVIKKDLMVKVNGFTLGLEGAQDYDLYLKVLELTDKIVHIPKVLYHWRKIPGSTAAEFSDKSYAQEAGRKAIENSLKRSSLEAKAGNSPYPGLYKVDYEIINNPLVSIIIPFKDKAELLKVCVDSIIEKTTYANFEIIGISNNSVEKETFDEMNRLKDLDKRIEFYEYNVPFNYSDINNYAIKNYAKGEHIILLNNDIEIITDKWIEEMLMYSQQTRVGCVGAKLYYPNDTIQHAGVIIGLGGVACHSHKDFPRNHPGYFRRLQSVQNLSAVTAACLMVKRSIFDQLNGLNEIDLKVAFNDVDFCLRVKELGYSNLFTPYCEAYHHESISRGLEDNPEKVKRFNGEIEFMQNRHKEILKNGDPFYNVNLTLNKEDFGLKD